MKKTKFIFATFVMTVWGVSGLAQHHCSMGSSGHDHSKSEATATQKSETSVSQNNQSGLKTETFKVSGNCGICKSTIEKAAVVSGVSDAKWETETKVLTISYDPSLTTSDSVLRLVADAGYDNVKYSAKDETYDALPGCCKYERNNEKE